MKQQRKILCTFFFLGFCFAILQAQETIPAAGVNASGSGGSISYTVGQILCSSISGSNGTVVQGVQQPYEISIVTEILDVEAINLNYLVYPNPTSGLLRLVIESPDFENMRLSLYDISGILLRDMKIESSETEISLGEYTSSTYFLKIFRNNLEIKVFKIIKSK